MKATAFLALVLTPVIVAAPRDQLPKSVRSLLKHPRTGRARLTWLDGTSTDGSIIRVTNNFVTFCKVPSNDCGDVDLTKIAAVNWLPETKRSDSGEDLSGPEGYLLLPVVVSAAGLHYVKEPFVSRFSKLGWWESVSPAPDGSVSWVEFEKPALVARIDALVKQGRYRVEGERLYVAYITSDGASAPEEVIPVGGDTALRLKERLQDHQTQRHSHYPIVIQLPRIDQGVRIVRAFQADGTCRIETNNHSEQGSFEKTKDGVRVQWRSPRAVGIEENWATRRTGPRLFITHNGDTVEYKRIKWIE